jgi:DNA-binding LacI/PurR family transcriptional regulator
MTPRPASTIVDVAREAGVSVSTVSRILNDKPDVAQETRDRVLGVIKELGWVPHSQAKRLKEGGSQTVALLDPVNLSGDQPINQVHLDFMIGAANAAGQENYFFNVLTAPITEETLVDLYRSVQVDGVILMEVYLDDWRVELARRIGFPFVMIGRQTENVGVGFIDLDIDAATQAAFDHLANLGHRNIAFMGFPEWLRLTGHGPAVRGWTGYQAAVDRLGLEPIACECGYTLSEMEAAADRLLDKYPGITAIVALTDAPLAGVFSALRRRGREIPDDVSVVGMAVDRIAELLTPRLTAVRFPSYDIGFQATSMLIRQLGSGPNAPEQVVLAPELVVRDSSGPPR